MKRKLSSLVLACMVVSNPLASFSAFAQTSAFNPKAPTPGKFGLSTTKGFKDLGQVKESGGFIINDPNVLGELGYDPSRAWKAGDNYADFLKVGDVDKLVNIKNLTPRQLADKAGVDINQVPIEGVFGRQTLGDIVRLNPALANAPVESIPAIRDLVNGQWSQSVTNGLNLASRYSPELNHVLANYPELKTLPLKSVLRGDFSSVLNSSQQIGLRELSKQLPAQLQDLPAQSIPALQSLVNGDVSSFASQGFNLAVDRSKVLQDLVQRYPALEQVPVGDILKGNWSRVLNRGEQLALKELDRRLSADVKGVTGKYAPVIDALSRGKIKKAAALGLDNIKAFNDFLDANPQLKGLPIKSLLRGDIQAALPHAQQVAIYEISKALPAQYHGLPADSLNAINALSRGNWEDAINQGIEVSAREVQAVSKFYEKHPELADLEISEILKGDFGSAISVGEKKALEELSNVNPYLGELPIRDILGGDFKSTLNKGLKIAGKELIGEVLGNNPALENVALGVLDNPAYSLGSVPGLADTAFAQIKGIDGTPLADVPGLKDVPLDLISANTLAALVKGDLFLNIDLVLGPKELIARNTLTGFSRGKKHTPTPCDAQDSKTTTCAHGELTDRKGKSGDGKQIVLGEAQQGKGGWSFLKDVANSGYEKTGLQPWGTSAKTSNLKLVVSKVEEVSGTKTSTSSGFRVATESGYLEFGLTFGVCIDTLFIDTCTSSFIDLPLEFFPEEIIDFKVAEGGKVLIATTSPAPKIPRRLRRRARRQLGLPEDDYCDVPSSINQQASSGPKTYDDADPSDLVQVGTYQGRPEYLHKDLAPVWEKMKQDAARDGVNLTIISGTRTKADQQSIIDYKRNELGQSDEQIFKVNTRPGESEHHTAFTLDIGDGDAPGSDLDNSFRDTNAGQWLAKNGAKYGFEKSYPHEDNNGIQREEWHWRFIGSEKAKQALKLESHHANDGHDHNHDGDAAITSIKVPHQGVSLDAIREAIIGKESGYNYQAVNRDSGALGFGQVMPFNVGPWTQSALGRALSPQEFLENPDAQITTINHRLGVYLDNELRATGGDDVIAIRRVASTWYSGQPHLYDDPTPQTYGSGSYPSIQSYTQDVLRRYNDFAKNGGFSTYAGGANPCLASAGGPVGPFTQGDGITKGNFINPSPGPITSVYGWREHPELGGRRFHKGIDIGLSEGTPVKAADGGVVIYSYNQCVAWNDGCGGPDTDGRGARGGFGNRVEIRHSDGSVTAYNHLKDVAPPVGAQVSQGQVIGTVGSTGISTGPHLDFQVYPDGESHANPELYINFR